MFSFLYHFSLLFSRISNPTEQQDCRDDSKQHKNVMQAIRNMEPAWEKVNGLKFQLVEYRERKGELRPCYSLTKTECLYINILRKAPIA